MKIKLSKIQWSEIGKRAGWIKILSDMEKGDTPDGPQRKVRVTKKFNQDQKPPKEMYFIGEDGRYYYLWPYPKSFGQRSENSYQYPKYLYDLEDIK